MFDPPNAKYATWCSQWLDGAQCMPVAWAYVRTSPPHRSAAVSVCCVCAVCDEMFHPPVPDALRDWLEIGDWGEAKSQSLKIVSYFRATLRARARGVPAARGCRPACAQCSTDVPACSLVPPRPGAVLWPLWRPGRRRRAPSPPASCTAPRGRRCSPPPTSPLRRRNGR